MTHDDMCKRAAKWLRSRKPTTKECWSPRACRLVLKEVTSGSGEIPDAIGWWGGGHSILVECKVSRSDYLRDQKKWQRHPAASSMGSQRYYMTPPGLLSPDELPEGWGLLEVHSRSVRVVKEAPIRVLEPGGYLCELVQMMRGIRMVNGEDTLPTKKSAAYVGEES